MREICTSGSVRGEGGNILTYSASLPLERCEICVEGLAALHETGRLTLLGDLVPLADQRAFDAALAPLRQSECRVGGDVAIPTPHSPGRADFPHPVLHERDSLAAA